VTSSRCLSGLGTVHAYGLGGLLLAAALGCFGCARAISSAHKPCPCADGNVCCEATGSCAHSQSDCKMPTAGAGRGGSGAGEAANSDAGRANAGHAAAGNAGDADVNAGHSSAGSDAAGHAGDAEAAGHMAAGRDAAGSGRSDSAGSASEPPSATSFVLENAGTQPVCYVKDSCNDEWLQLRTEQAQEITYTRNCYCPCSTPEACHCDTGCPRPATGLLMPGETSTIHWDGVALVRTQASCYDAFVPKRGAQLLATACWNRDSEQCASQPFQYATDSTVTVQAVTNESVQANWEIYLWNDTGGPIEIVTEHCGRQGWFELDEGARISASASCLCTCGADVAPGTCPACGSCGADVVQTLEPGGMTLLSWNGKFWYAGTNGCAIQYDMPPTFRMLHAKICWQKPGTGAVSCIPISFQNGAHYRPQDWHAQ
jgi:hypothetical protein